jgi:signal transduction histidine kinase
LLVEQSASLAATDAALNRLGAYLLLGVLGGTLVGVVLVLVFTKGVLGPLDRVADTADAIASGDFQRRLQLPAGRNEVARLGKAFDYIVGRLVAALETQRRFVADASHELRTPLTSLK